MGPYRAGVPACGAHFKFFWRTLCPVDKERYASRPPMPLSDLPDDVLSIVVQYYRAGLHKRMLLRELKSHEYEQRLRLAAEEAQYRFFIRLDPPHIEPVHGYVGAPGIGVWLDDSAG